MDINPTTVAISIGITSIVFFASMPLFRRGNSSISSDPSKSAVLITGGSRGIGRSTADYLAGKGYTVLVTVRKQAQFDELEQLVIADADENSENNTTIKKIIYPVLMDVTNDDHVTSAIQRVQTVLKKAKEKEEVRLVAIINNAGINPEGDAIAKCLDEGQEAENELADPSSVAMRVFETNVVGVIRVTKAFLPLLVGSAGGSGRIIIIGSYFGSIAGKAGLGHACYEASKFALEGLSDNMRRSLQKEGSVKVCLIKPGNIATDMNKAFGEVGPEAVAKDIEHAIASPNPRPRYYPGTVKGYNTKFLCWIYEMLPTWLVDWL